MPAALTYMTPPDFGLDYTMHKGVSECLCDSAMASLTIETSISAVLSFPLSYSNPVVLIKPFFLVPRLLQFL